MTSSPVDIEKNGTYPQEEIRRCLLPKAWIQCLAKGHWSVSHTTEHGGFLSLQVDNGFFPLRIPAAILVWPRGFTGSAWNNLLLLLCFSFGCYPEPNYAVMGTVGFLLFLWSSSPCHVTASLPCGWPPLHDGFIQMVWIFLSHLSFSSPSSYQHL